ncbi:1-acyl-sn-glycerol-3-phosphate acyltransferase [Spirochaetia bacterium]|nr:1-acyl-sn-glycerol-3-phosphate acyltransferase [Spirochaetia bacterium]
MLSPEQTSGQSQKNMELPPITNYPLYVYRVFAKWLSFLYFGIGSLFIICISFPIMRLRFRTREEFQRRGHALVSSMWANFCLFLRFVGAAKTNVSDRPAFSNLKSKIIVANHPSLLDVVMLIALIPNADCIVNASLTRTVVGNIVKRLYILNSLEFDDLKAACLKTLEAGNCLIIFPEGSRTPRTGHLPLKRGAARLALMCGRPVVPVHIGGNDKWGLGKHDPLLAYNHTEEYVYSIQLGRELNTADYAGLPSPIAARRLTADIEKAIFCEN